jgi:hypothetical protein
VIKNFSFDVYVDEDFINKTVLIKELNENNISYKYKNKLNKFCILSSQRTGSTVLIDHIQKLSSNSLCLSEIFYLYQRNDTYKDSYDVTTGVLKDFKIQSLKELKFDIFTYLKQFEDFAVFQDKNYFIHKLTIDFSQSLDMFYMFDEIFNLIKKDSNVIYLERDAKDIYISKKLADKYGYSNSLYEKIEESMFSYTELDEQTKRLQNFEREYLIFKPYKKINYNDFCNNLDELYIFINNLFNKCNVLPNLIDSNFYEIVKSNKKEDYFNSKQNKFSCEELTDEKYWCE